MIWIIGGVVLGVALIILGVYLGRRARIRRRETLQRFARREKYTFDAATDTIRGEIDGVPFEIRTLREPDEEGETVSVTEVWIDREVDLSEIGPERTPMAVERGTAWRRSGRARRTKKLRREVDLLRSLLR